MKKTNFTDLEILTIIKTLSPQLSVRVNKAGNITVYNPKEVRGFWTLYNVNNRFLWRHHDGNGYCFPLNMIGRKRIGPINTEVWDYGYVYKWYEREAYNIDNSYFNSVNDALNYFVKYLKKYRNINL